MGKTLIQSLAEKAISKELEKNTTVSSATQASVATAVAPMLVNATNNEPWFQSRVTLGSILATLGSLNAILLDLVNGGGIDVAVMSSNLAVVIGAVYAIYGRWTAKKPLF